MPPSQTHKPASHRPYRTLAEIAAILEEYSTSALLQQDFAERVGIGRSTLQYWLRRARRGTPSGARKRVKSRLQPPSLIEVELEGGLRTSCGEARYELELPNGMRLRTASAFNDQDVRRLLSLMKEVR